MVVNSPHSPDVKDYWSWAGCRRVLHSSACVTGLSGDIPEDLPTMDSLGRRPIRTSVKQGFTGRFTTVRPKPADVSTSNRLDCTHKNHTQRAPPDPAML